MSLRYCVVVLLLACTVSGQDSSSNPLAGLLSGSGELTGNAYGNAYAGQVADGVMGMGGQLGGGLGLKGILGRRRRQAIGGAAGGGAQAGLFGFPTGNGLDFGGNAAAGGSAGIMPYPWQQPSAPASTATTEPSQPPTTATVPPADSTTQAPVPSNDVPLSSASSDDGFGGFLGGGMNLGGALKPTNNGFQAGMGGNAAMSGGLF